MTPLNFDTHDAGGGTATWRSSDGRPAPIRIPARPRPLHRIQARLLLLAGDALAVIGGFGGVALLRLELGQRDEVGGVVLVFLPLFLLLAFYHRAYSREVTGHWRRGYRRAAAAMAVAMVALIGFAFGLKTSHIYSRALVTAGLAASFLLLVAARWATTRLTGRFLPGAQTSVAMLIDGTADVPATTTPTTIIDARRHGLRPDLRDPVLLDRIGRLLRGYDRVVVACGPETRDRWTAALKGLGTAVEVLVPELEPLGILAIGRHGTRLTALVGRGPLAPSDLVLKRAFDLAAVVLLLPGLLVVTAVVALAIKLDDGGPIFFRQQRVGLGNRLFDILKFRTMRHHHADGAGRRSAARDDARVTRVGRLLRRTSADELPQLFNVLTGAMSLVGPRPHALGSLAGDAPFWDVDHRYWQRHVVKPGLTGLAQVRGYRGATERSSDLVNRVQADLDYIDGWTIWRDLRIIALTSGVLLHPNAY